MNNIMKVLYFYHRDDGSYGAAKSMNRLIQLLKENHNVIPIIITPYKNYNNSFADKNGIENYVIPYQHNVWYSDKSFFRNIYYIIRNSVDRFLLPFRLKKIDFSNIDIVHSASAVINIGSIVARKKNIIHIWHIRELNRKWKYLNQKKTISLMNASTDEFVTISDAVNIEWKKLGIHEDKMIRIYNGITPVLTVERQEEKENKLKFVFTGYISEAKGQLGFLKSISLIPEIYKKMITIDFYGNGEKVYYNKLKSYAEHNLGDVQINFKGYKKNIETILANYDIGIINSKAEAFGRTTVEYMMAELLVYASNTGANPELIRDGETGILFDRENLNDLAEKISDILENREMIKNISENARLYAENNFSDVMNAEKIFAEYRNLLGG